MHSEMIKAYPLPIMGVFWILQPSSVIVIIFHIQFICVSKSLSVWQIWKAIAHDIFVIVQKEHNFCPSAMMKNCLDASVLISCIALMSSHDDSQRPLELPSSHNIQAYCKMLMVGKLYERMQKALNNVHLRSLQLFQMKVSHAWQLQVKSPVKLINLL